MSQAVELIIYGEKVITPILSQTTAVLSRVMLNVFIVGHDRNNVGLSAKKNNTKATVFQT